MRLDSRGVVLLEVLAAIMILGIGGTALIELVAGGTRAVATARDRERQLADEERLFSAYALLTRSDLDRRLGRRLIGPYFLVIQRPEPVLYRVAIGRTDVLDVEDLVTVVYRPEAPRGP
jgi:hypothetical protein